ncbi:5815_t:CDS:2 [Ambispora leptoticha]|uniref:5815_t:CDS:1 n=1 Tax=Ambispora leptoticha TaxID=144679 RepID=A0A9N9ENQ5_9GLOM|nr:5815_t:CDS:2 [Ambispora leptoticha]
MPSTQPTGQQGNQQRTTDTRVDTEVTQVATVAHRELKLKYSAQFKASRAITSCAKPSLQLVIQTIETQPPRRISLSQDELTILAQLNPAQFNVVTPVNKLAFDYLTQDHPNWPFIQYLKDGLKYGFRFNFTGKRSRIVQENLNSVKNESSALTNYINSELALGRMCRPFTMNNLPCTLFQINPCGLVKKKNTKPKSYRVISHLSAPSGKSINDGINNTDFITKYENINHAISWIIQYGRGCLLSKIDIQDAYRILPVYPVDQVLQGLQYDGKIYFDKALSFGNRASGGIFCWFADVITWIAIKYGIKSVIHYVDDFLIISKTGASQELEQFLRILKSEVYFIEDREWLQPDIQNLHTDASSLSGGATYRSYFTAFNWSQETNITEHSIQMRELLTCLIAMLTFTPLWLQKRLIIWTDNQANTEAYYASFCKNLTVNSIIASMYRAQVRGNYSIKLEYIAGPSNNMTTEDNNRTDEIQTQIISSYENELPLNEQVATILGIKPPIHKTYAATIKRYERLATENEWMNENGTIWPISKENLTKYITYLHLKLNMEDPDGLLFWSVALVAFYGLTRLGELLSRSQNESDKIPTIQALRFDKCGTDTFATIQLPRTKNHKVVERPILIINPTKDELCPVNTLKAYTVLRTNSIYAPRAKALFQECIE